MAVLLAFLRSTVGVALIAALIAGSSGVWLGWRYADALGDERVARCNQRSADAVAAAERAARRRIEAAQVAGDAALLNERLRVESVTRTTEELQHALNRVTSDRTCLGGAARRLLNRSPGIAAASLPARAGGAAAAVATATADPGIVAGSDSTSERDTAAWIARAAGQYDACRARIDAVAEWQRGMTDAK